jgi:anaerobic selenocysteine-containing dehydrogenase
MVDDEGSPLYPGGYPEYMVKHERKPGIGLLAGWRGANGGNHGKGTPNPEQIERYVENGCFWREPMPEEARFYKFANKAYLDYAVEMGFLDAPNPVTLELYSETLQKFRLAAQGHGAQQPPESERQRIATFFDPLPMWYAPLEDACSDAAEFPLHAITQRPMAMYHSWGSQNAWSRQIIDRNKLYIERGRGEEMGLADDDWVWAISPHGRVKAQIKLMSGLNPDTVWTWNAIGKRAGTWGLKPSAPESNQGFLLNHLITETLPADSDGVQRSNSDPVTGQAAWYDVRVRIEKCTASEAGVTEPRFEPLRHPSNGTLPDKLDYGRQFRVRKAR